ncbi:MAG: YibE/F family protein [Coriobacteriaceae bacterium]|nr:YibE/F family protein [Coriobacteriaceae bacterium]
MQKLKKALLAGNGVCAAAVAMVLLAAAAIMWNQMNPASFTILSVGKNSYSIGRVVEVDEGDIAYDESSDRELGLQRVRVELQTGAHKGEVQQIANDLSATHNIRVHEGSSVVVKIDEPGDAKPFYSIFNYNRLLPIAALIAVFALVMIAVGGAKGAKSLLGLVFSLVMIVQVLIPGIYWGVNPVLMTLVVASLITVLNMVLLNGLSAKTATAVAATISGLAISALLYAVFSGAMHLSGYNLAEADELIGVHVATGMDIGSLLFVGVVISALGAVMDMCMSVASSLFEMKRLHQEMTGAQVVKSGMAIGQDMIGTMCMTLILAFAGAAVLELLVLIAYGAQFESLIASDYVAQELLQSLIGGVAVVLAVPLTAVFSGWAVARMDARSSREV